jgi:hypothetical protein
MLPGVGGVYLNEVLYNISNGNGPWGRPRAAALWNVGGDDTARKQRATGRRDLQPHTVSIS